MMRARVKVAWHAYLRFIGLEQEPSELDQIFARHYAEFWARAARRRPKKRTDGLSNPATRPRDARGRWLTLPPPRPLATGAWKPWEILGVSLLVVFWVVVTHNAAGSWSPIAIVYVWIKFGVGLLLLALAAGGLYVGLLTVVAALMWAWYWTRALAVYGWDRWCVRHQLNETPEDDQNP